MSRSVGVLRATVVAQIFAIEAAMLVSAPNFIDHLTRPLICPPATWCLDFRGVDFGLWVLVFTPVVLALALAAWQLRWRPGLAIRLVIVIDLAILGLAADAAIQRVPYQGLQLDPDAPPYLWDALQNALIFVPAVANVVLALAALVRRRSAMKVRGKPAAGRSSSATGSL